MLKVDLHIHTAEDPMDSHFKHDARQLIDRASELGFDVISITNHCKVTYTPELGRYARQRHVTLIPGCEAMIEGKHVLLYNITETERVSIRTFDDLRRLKAIRGKTMLVLAPHPGFPSKSSLRRRQVGGNADIFDAIERSQYGNGFLNLNRQAYRHSRRLDKPLVATSDAHSFRFFGNQYSFVDGQRSVQGVMDAVREGRVRSVVGRLGIRDVLHLSRHTLTMRLRRLLGLPSRKAF